MSGRRIRIVIPIIAVFIGVYLLIGCIPIPATRQLQPDLSHRPEHYVGASNDNPVQLGHTKIDDAFIVLSQAVKATWSGGYFGSSSRSTINPRWSIMKWRVSPDAREFSIGYSIRTATWIMPLCFSAPPETERRWLTLKVDSNGTVIHSKTTEFEPYPERIPMTRWLEVFDPATRQKLRDRGVFPSDEELKQAEDYSQRSDSLRIRATMPSTAATEPIR